ncbi:DUF488 domain-containing protein [Clostridium perfringens]|uniref:DUF488 domain-containing protein n=1 Tax=Clostridium perfringens TaxID=1502 RepID=UPI0013E2C8DC|nr:DUF488 domain-containing protein [Clostridium perfringens]NGS95794.1 DUF488 domain-containing protein [Clostridium perfringens]
MSKGILYTSYFGNWRKWKQLDAFTVAVCRKRPPYMNYDKEGIQELLELAPSEGLLNAYKNDLISQDDFRNKFLDELDNVKSANTLFLIQSLLDMGVNICLLCYESNNDFCHRRIVAEIFDEAGYKIIKC